MFHCLENGILISFY